MAALIFRNFGGIRQYVARDADDLALIDRLDPALWSATSAPTRDFHCDPALFDYLDPDKTGRIRVSQILEARDWLFAQLSNRTQVSQKSDVLVLDSLATTEDAAKLRKAAEHVIAKLGLSDTARLSLESLRAFRTSCAKLLENGDGIVPPEVVTDGAAAAFLRDVMAIVGSAPDASGLPGVGAAQLDRYVEGARAWSAWRAGGTPENLPFGARTGDFAALVEELDPKVSEYFWQCALLLQTQRTGEALRAPDEEVRRIAAEPGPQIEHHLAEAPLAPPTPKGRLTLDANVNGFYADKLAQLRDEILPRILGPDARSITREEWKRVRAYFQPWRDWQAKKPTDPFDKLSEPALTAAMHGALADRARKLIERDLGASEEIARLGTLEKLILYQRWLVELANNFVSFSALYDPTQQPLVRDGSLVIDGRRLEFAMRIPDRAAHRKLATESGIFLVYASVSDGESGQPAYDIVTPVTGGERGRLRIGKRGLYIDRTGKERDAIVVDLVENAVSIAEAVRAPFRRMSQFVSKRIEDMASSQLESKVAASQTNLGQGVDHAAAGNIPVPAAAAPAAAPASGGSGMRDLILGGGIAFAALGSALAFVVSALSKVHPLNAVIALLSVVLVIMALSAFLGWLKLRRRDMAFVFEANGWALNPRMKITRRLGRVFTRTPPLPPEAVIEKRDLLRKRG